MKLRIALCGFFFCMTIPLSATCFSACVKEGGVLEVKGRISRAVFPSPPNYEDITRGDAAEPVAILTLVKPICLERISPEGGAPYIVGPFRKLQLGFTNPSLSRFRSSESQLVLVRGAVSKSVDSCIYPR